MYPPIALKVFADNLWEHIQNNGISPGSLTLYFAPDTNPQLLSTLSEAAPAVWLIRQLPNLTMPASLPYIAAACSNFSKWSLILDQYQRIRLFHEYLVPSYKTAWQCLELDGSVRGRFDLLHTQLPDLHPITCVLVPGRYNPLFRYDDNFSGEIEADINGQRYRAPFTRYKFSVKPPPAAHEDRPWCWIIDCAFLSEANALFVRENYYTGGELCAQN